ncbi:glutathione S-transferase N-terminal domain-containing protein [Denitrobaculum tricleocarpae]|uniref:Glutathione S-transferase n=1 Tax=Denitrobaculum tricleocarpae TaxID=2591009 RepID=A0A545U1M9_9PROT|nr:glutathione S-transferase N-terminal domain-containing protein [Denitrobaculum tricleocarpae]TQV83389.1 glutathione S-transferase [Denitrobaculum tricleocarpae]
MHLRHSATSPYARKVRVLAQEAGLSDRIELHDDNPMGPGSDLSSINPLGKVPALILDDGMVLCDSPVICQYLDSLHDGEKFTPESGSARFADLNLEALADGLLDAALARMVEMRMRPENLRWEGHHKRMRAKISRTLDHFESMIADGSLPSVPADNRPTLGIIAVGCALGYLDLRFAVDNWREGRPGLTSWYETLSARPSMQDTRPPES